ncbi:MAG: flagellar FliJ family protein [Bdellovibrionales bacterium]
MTKTLATLIKVHQHELDAQRRVVAELEAVQARLVAALEQLQAEMAHEKDVSQHDAEAAQRWPDYIQYALRREAELKKQIAEFEKQIEQARALLQERFAELKKFELAKEASDAEVAASEARDERLEIDEIAGIRARKDI